MPHYVASDLGLHCLPMTLFSWVSMEDRFKGLSVSALFAANRVDPNHNLLQTGAILFAGKKCQNQDECVA